MHRAVRRALPLAALLLPLLGLAPARAQQAPARALRTLTVARQLHGESRLVTRLDYAAGTLRLRPGAPGTLYRLRLTYDDQRFAPIDGYDAATGTVRLGLAAAGGTLRLASNETTGQVATLALSPAVDHLLDLRLGAVDGDIELGGLRIQELALRAEGSRTVVHFSTPNAARCTRAELTAGAAELTVVGLGNSRCDSIAFQGGAGQTVLDFSGAWSSSARVTVKMTVGELVLRLPRRVGVRLTLDKFLASFRPAGLEARGTSYYSPGYAAEPRHLDIDLTTAIGGVRVEWVE